MIIDNDKDDLRTQLQVKVLESDIWKWKEAATLEKISFREFVSLACNTYVARLKKKAGLK